MSATAVRERPDTQEMVVIHRIFRRGFTRLADLARQVPPHDTEWADAVAAHAEFLLDGLRHHHTAEDEHLWPRLLERTHPDAALVARMEDQHAVVATHVARVRELLPGWRAAPSGRGLADALDDLGVALAQHLDEEEAEILPLVRAHVTVVEWREGGDAAFAKFSDEEKLIALGQMLDVASPEEAAGFLATLPPPIRVMWRLVGRRRYARYMDRLSRTAGPKPPMTSLRRRWLRMGNRIGVRMYRTLDGRLASGSKDVHVLMITTPGRRTGIPRSTCVRYLETPDGLVVWGTGSGSRRDPDWFQNLRAVEEADVQVGARRFRVRPRELVGAERDRMWNETILTEAPGVVKYEQKAGRVIPVAVLQTADA